MPRILLATALVVALAFTANAEHCTTWTTSAPEIDTTIVGGSYYVENNRCDELCDIWIYEESNGLPGLQREDEVVDDTCHGLVDGDAIVF